MIERISAEGGSPATANTQYQHWKANHDAAKRSQPAPDVAELRDVGDRSLKIGGDGRVVVPEEMRAAMLLDGEGRVTARVEGGELRLTSQAVAIKRMQLEARPCMTPGEGVVDQFLAGRREMWGEV